MLWYLVAVMLLIALVGVWIYGSRTDWENIFSIFSAIFLGTAILVICITTVASTFEYKEFEQKYAIQKEQFEHFIKADEDMSKNIIYVADIITINNELAAMQAHKQMHGNWSVVSDHVFELTPIGLGESEEFIRKSFLKF